MNNLYAVLEIGTTRTVLAIGEAETGGRLKVTCHAEIPSTGVRKSQILDISQATQSIRAVLGEIEKKQAADGSKVTIGNAFLLVSGQSVKADRNPGTVLVGGSTVGEAEIAEVIHSAHQMVLPKDRELLDIADQDYAVDNLQGIPDPRGMTGRILNLNTLQIHTERNRLQDARTAAEGAHLEIREPLFATTCAADAVLEEHEKKNGVLVLDLGGGSTGYAVYSGGFLVTTGVVGVGGDHVTNDIAHAFQTTNAQAEDLKIHEANAMLRTIDETNARVKIPGTNPLLEGRTISRRALDTIVNARLKELVTVIAEILEGQDLLQRLHAGVVLTGGGALLRDLDALVQQILGTSVRIGRPLHVDGFSGDDCSPAFAAVAGALLYAHRNYEEKSILDGLFGRFFK